MGNSESSPDDAYENFPRQPPPPPSHGGFPVETGYRTQSPEHASSSTPTNYQSHVPSHARTSTNTTNYRKKQHSAYIADNFNSLDEFDIPGGAKEPAAAYMIFNKDLTGVAEMPPPSSSKPDKASSSNVHQEESADDVKHPFGPAPEHYEPAITKLMFQAISLEYACVCEQIRVLEAKKGEIEDLLILAGGTPPGGANGAQATDADASQQQ